AGAAFVSQAPRWPPRGRHDIHIRRTFFASDKRQLRAVWRKPRAAGLTYSSRQPVCQPTAGAHAPQVVFAGEDKLLTMQRGKSKIAEVRTTHARNTNEEAGRDPTLGLSCEHLLVEQEPQHVGQDAAMAVVLDFDRRIDPTH